MKKIQNSYKQSGVNISIANSFVNHIAKLSKKNDQKTKNSFNRDNIGSFGSFFDIFFGYSCNVINEFISYRNVYATFFITIIFFFHQ